MFLITSTCDWKCCKEARIDISVCQNHSLVKEKSKIINASDFTFLCLPDAAAIESAALCTNPHTKIIDASTAHRTNPAWAYGFPELSSDHRKKVETSKRIAVPGCYASGFNALVYPLVKSGILPSDYPVVCHAVSGYSGAGKKAIAQYGDENRDFQLESPRLYALTQEHKHLPEMQKVSGLTFKPAFSPYICDYFSGMSVSIPLHIRMLNSSKGPAVRSLRAQVDKVMYPQEMLKYLKKDMKS